MSSGRKLALGCVAVLAAIAVALVLLIGGAEDEEQIAQALAGAATSTDPDYCTELVTVDYLEQRTGLEGDDAVSDCEQRAAGESPGMPADVELVDVEVDGATATATTHIIGGDLHGARSIVRLVEDDGWRLDRVLGFEEVDREAYTRSYTESLGEAPYRLGSAEAECVAERILGGSAADFGAALVDIDLRGVATAMVSCDRAAVVRLIADSFADADPGTTADDCVRARAPRLADDRLIDIYLDPALADSLLASCGIAD